MRQENKWFGKTGTHDDLGEKSEDVAREIEMEQCIESTGYEGSSHDSPMWLDILINWGMSKNYKRLGTYPHQLK